MAETAFCFSVLLSSVLPELLTNIPCETFQKASYKLIIQAYKADLKSFFGTISPYYLLYVFYMKVFSLLKGKFMDYNKETGTGSNTQVWPVGRG